MGQRFNTWLYGLVSGFIGGGATAITSSMVLPAIDGKDFNFSSGLHNMLVVCGTLFVVHGVITAAAYLAKSPLPQQKEIWTEEQRDAYRKSIASTGK